MKFVFMTGAAGEQALRYLLEVSEVIFLPQFCKDGFSMREVGGFRLLRNGHLYGTICKHREV